MSKIPEIKGSYEILRQDVLTKSIIEIDMIHSKIHQGANFLVTDIATGIDTATPKKYLFITPNTQTRIHIVFSIETEPGSTLELYEDTTVSNNGTALTPVNHRRDVTFTSEMLVYVGPTVTVDGTRLFIARSGTTTAGGKVKGEISHLEEFILDVNSKYQIKITPLSNNSAVSVDFQWYEVR